MLTLCSDKRTLRRCSTSWIGRTSSHDCTPFSSSPRSRPQGPRELKSACIPPLWGSPGWWLFSMISARLFVRVGCQAIQMCQRRG